MLFYIPAHCFHKTFNERLNAASIIVSLLIESDAWFLLLILYLEQLFIFF